MNGTPLATLPRRLCKRDVGNSTWSGEGSPDDNLADCLDCRSSLDDELVSCHSVGLAEAIQHAFDHDMANPLELGLDLG